MNTTTTKACRLCGDHKPLDNFLLDHGARDGRDNRCRPCVLAQRQRRRKHAARRAAEQARAERQSAGAALKAPAPAALAATSETETAQAPSPLIDLGRLRRDAALEFARSAVDDEGNLALTKEHWKVLRTPAPSLTRNLLLVVLARHGYEVIDHYEDGTSRILNGQY